MPEHGGGTNVRAKLIRTILDSMGLGRPGRPGNFSETGVRRPQSFLKGFLAAWGRPDFNKSRIFRVNLPPPCHPLCAGI